MKTIQIRDVPDSIHRTLRERAAGADISLSDYLLAEVTRIAERPAISDVLRLSSARHGGTEAQKVVAAVRSGRDLA